METQIQKIKINTFLNKCKYLRFGDYILFQEISKHRREGDNHYATISKPILAIYLNSDGFDQTAGFYFVKWINECRTLTSEAGYKYIPEPEIKLHVEWDDYINILGWWHHKPNWKEIIKAYRRMEAPREIDVSEIDWEDQSWFTKNDEPFRSETTEDWHALPSKYDAIMIRDKLGVERFGIFYSDNKVLVESPNQYWAALSGFEAWKYQNDMGGFKQAKYNRPASFPPIQLITTNGDIFIGVYNEIAGDKVYISIPKDQNKIDFADVYCWRYISDDPKTTFILKKE